MKEFKKDWLTEGLLDFEYKKYILLAYLQYVEQHFDEIKLFPFMTELIERYDDLRSIHKEKKIMRSDFPKRISRLDLNKLELIYQKIFDDDELPAALEELIDFALPVMERSLEKGREIHHQVSTELAIDTVGIIPLYKEEGYLFMENGSRACTEVFQFGMRKFILQNEQFRGIHFQWLDRFFRGVGDTFENLKISLIRRYKELPNPATFIISSGQRLPLEETLVPLSKRLLLQTITQMK